MTDLPSSEQTLDLRLRGETSTSIPAMQTEPSSFKVAIVGASAIGNQPSRWEALHLQVAGLGLVAAALYGRDLFDIFRDRKRRQLELNTRMATLSFASLAGTAFLCIALLVTGDFAAHLGAFVFLAVFGWLSGLVLAKLYKIVAFLTWLETYGPVMRRAPTPRVQDLVAEGRASKWFVTYYAAVWFGTLMLLAGEPSAFRAAAAVMTVGIVGIVREAIRTRRLAEVASPLRLMGGACAPLLFARS